MKRRTTLFAALAIVWALSPTAALGHAQKSTADPEAGSKVDAPVDHLIINMTETPVEDATTVEVVDGCKRVLASDHFTEEKTIHVNVNEVGQPGKWRVRYQTLSAEDGHTSGDKYSFKVKGKKDCSAPAASPSPDASAAPGDGDGAASEEDEGGSFPVVPVAAAAVAIVGVALLARGGSKG